MAGPRAYYSLETQAHRDGYLFPDEDGQTMEGDALWAGWGAPAVLEPGFDSEDVWRRWKGGLMVSFFFFFFGLRGLLGMGVGGAGRRVRGGMHAYGGLNVGGG